MQSLIYGSSRKWKSHIGFPFSSLEQTENHLEQLYQQRDNLKKITASLIQQWNEQFPRSTVPVYLTRVSDKSFSTLRWRLSATHSNKASQLSFSAAMLDYFHIEKDRILVCLFESRKQDIDLQLSLLLYEILRIETYLKNISTLRQIKKVSNE